MNALYRNVSIGMHGKQLVYRLLCLNRGYIFYMNRLPPDKMDIPCCECFNLGINPGVNDAFDVKG